MDHLVMLLHTYTYLLHSSSDLIVLYVGGSKKNVYMSSGHAFSADNPYGKKAAGDKRQFVR